MGIKGSSTTSLSLSGVRVPKENLLGLPGKGMAIALDILNVGRLKLGAADLGGCKNAIGLATTYALERLQFGQPVAYFEAVRRKLADMVVRTYLLDAAIYRTYCSQCHGSGATGAKGYPNLQDDDWLWGGTPQDIRVTIAHGIRFAQDDDTRLSDMPP